MANKNFEVKHGLSVGGTERITSAGAGSLTNLTLTGNLSHASDLTLDAGGDIILDADGTDIILKDGGTEFGSFKRVSSDFVIKSSTSDKDIVFKGVDNSTNITALTLDMSEAGTANFNKGAAFSDNVSIASTGDGLSLSRSGYDTYSLQHSSGNGMAIYNVSDSRNEMHFDGAGNVGINQTSPQAMLDLKGNTTTFDGMAKIFFTDVSGNAASRNFAIGNGGSAYGNLTFGVSNAEGGNPLSSSAYTAAMVINNTGNVGIGTVDPQTQLHVAGTNNSAGDLYTAVGAGNVPSITIQNAGTTDNNNAGLFFRDNDGMRASVAARFTNHSTNATQLRLSTTDAAGNTRERVIIHETGQITNPYQPSFMCYPNDHYTASAGSLKQSWTAEAHDSNNEYNNATHRFTAPVAGRYLFTGELSLNVSTTGLSYMGIGIRINGSGAIYYGGWQAKTGTSNQYEKVNSSIIKSLSAGDYVEIYVEVSSAVTILGGSNGQYSRFCGQLLS